MKILPKRENPVVAPSDNDSRQVKRQRARPAKKGREVLGSPIGRIRKVGGRVLVTTGRLGPTEAEKKARAAKARRNGGAA